jgi:pimeloyl-ACP methyl ester carboxylesterase
MAERQTNRARWVGALERMKQPFRFINGSADRISGRHLVERFRQIVPHQTDIIELENIGHFPHFEAPESVLKLFFEFHQNISAR